MLKALTFIGSGPNKYSPTTYYIDRDGEREFCETYLFPEAVVELYEPTELIAFATDEVMNDKHGHGYLNYLECVCRNHNVDFKALRIESGKSTDELWDIFNVYANAVNDNDEIVLDITHGFRSLPMLALPAIAYLRQVKNVEFKHILYGAFEAREPSKRDPLKTESPIFDLTLFVRLLNWTNAVNVFQHSGDARPLANLDGVGTIRDSLTTLSNALLTNRTLEAQTAVGRVIGGLTHPESLKQLPRPFGILVDQVKDTYTGISVRDPETNPKESLVAQYAQIKWYIDNLHYLHAITLIREWLVSLECRASRLNWLEDKSREWAEKRLNLRYNDRRKKKHLSTATGIDKLWGDCTDLRNDLAHCGMRPGGVRGSNAAIKGIKNLFKDFESFFNALVKTGELPPPK